jgi:transposase-like protein
MDKAQFDQLARQVGTLAAEQMKQLTPIIAETKRGNMAPKAPDSCPHCKSKLFKKNGRKGGKQRFLCKSCGRTFGSTNLTPLYRSRLSPATVKRLVELTLLCQSIPQAAKDCGINPKTVWLFRKKLHFAASPSKPAAGARTSSPTAR